MKFTSKPWRIEGQDIYGNEQNGYICTWSGRKANAHLISAAPDLLEACKHAFSFFNKRGEGPLLTSTEMYLELRDVIAEAEGSAS